MTQQLEWPALLEQIERDDVERRIWLSSWFVNTLSRRPDILEQLWNGSGGGDAVGWLWCEYRTIGRPTYPWTFLALYGPWLDVLPTAPVFVLRARCRHCHADGFFVTCNTSQSNREFRGNPSGRCAACKKAAANASARRSRAQRRGAARATPRPPVSKDKTELENCGRRRKSDFDALGG